MYREELGQIAQMVWESMLRLPLVPAEPTGPGDEPVLVAAIRFKGAWHGEVAATVGQGLARRIAGAMLETLPEALGDEDVHDALREMINMVGGNLKALLPPPCQLSLPQVVAVPDNHVASTGLAVDESLHFECEERLFEIALRASPTPA
jgi:chemotaxis protein CheX